MNGKSDLSSAQPKPGSLKDNARKGLEHFDIYDGLNKGSSCTSRKQHLHEVYVQMKGKVRTA